MDEIKEKTGVASYQDLKEIELIRGTNGSFFTEKNIFKFQRMNEFFFSQSNQKFLT